MVADAKALDNKGLSLAFQNPADDQERRRFVGSFSGHERNVFFRKDSDGFVDTSFASGLDYDEDGRAVAPIDMDGDGDLDLVSLSLTGLRVLQNRTPPGHWLRVTLVPKSGSSLGAVVRVIETSKADTSTRGQVAKVHVTAGFHTQVATALHFGLGKSPKADVEVVWPSGQKERFAGLSRAVVLHEGGLMKKVERVPWTTPVRADHSAFARMPAQTLGGQTESILAEDGRLTLVNLWSTTCTACSKEMPSLHALATESPSRLRVVGVAVGESDQDKALAYAHTLGVAYPLMLAPDALLERLNADRGLPLPSSYLFDENQRLIRVFSRALKDGELTQYLEAKAPSAEDHRVSAVAAIAAGKGQAAIHELERAVRLDSGNASAHWRLGNTLLRAKQVNAALAPLKTATELGPEDPESWVDLAEVYRQLGQDEPRLQALQTAVQFPESVRAPNRLGLYWMEKGKPSKAQDQYKVAIGRDATYKPALTNLSKAQRALGLIDDAQQTERRLRRLKSKAKAP